MTQKKGAENHKEKKADAENESSIRSFLRHLCLFAAKMILYSRKEKA